MTWSPEEDERDDRAWAEELLAPLDGRPGPARRLPPVVSAEIVRSVIETALDAPDDPAADLPPPPPPPPPRWRHRALVAAAAVAALSVGSGASAVAWRLLHVELGDPEPSPAPAPRVAPPRAPEAEPEPEPEEVVIPSAVVEPQRERAAEPPRRRVHKLTARPTRRAPAAAPAPVPLPSAPEPAAAPEREVVPNLPPADLLALANERRQRREWDAADVYYEAVVSRFPGTDAAVVAEIATAGLHLNQLGDPAGALHGYRRTLRDRPLGPLAEEARWGIVDAQRALGDKQGEVAALREFLQHHPDSAVAPAARRRLARLAP